MRRIIYHPGDVIVLWTGERCLEGCNGKNIKTVYRKNGADAGMFIGALTHNNHIASEYIASEIKERIIKLTILLLMEKMIWSFV